ncbi:MAG: cysteine-rich CWC family protein [Vulcanimicrobiaceae bacterium]
MREGAVERCPLCDGDNACGAAAGEPTCWCFTERIPPDVLERIPPEARGRVCVCRACATQDNARSSCQST